MWLQDRDIIVSGQQHCPGIQADDVRFALPSNFRRPNSRSDWDCTVNCPPISYGGKGMHWGRMFWGAFQKHYGASPFFQYRLTISKRIHIGR